MKLVFFALGLLQCQAVFADITIDSPSDSFALIYHSGDRVFYEKCTSRTVKRGCSGATDVSKLFSTSYESYIKHLESFYGLNSLEYSGVSGKARLADKIERIKNQIDHSDLSVSELKEAHELLKSLVTMRNQSVQAQIEIGNFLEPNQNTVFNEQFQHRRSEIALYAFYKMGFFKQEKTLLRLSDRPVLRDEANQVCKAMGVEWSPLQVPSSSAVAALLSVSPVMDDGPIGVWSDSPVEEAQYKFECYSQANFYSPRKFVETKYMSAERYAIARSTPQYGSINKACAIVNTDEIVTFIPTTAQVLYLAPREAQFRSVREALEISEGVLANLRRHTLCQRSYDSQDSDGRTPDQSNFASFSLYELDHGLDLLSRSVYQYWAEFFQSTSAHLTRIPLAESDDLRVAYRNGIARLLVLNLLEPVLNDIQSATIKENVLPNYLNAKEDWNSKFKVNSIRDIELTAETYRAALTMFHSGLLASRSFIQVSQQQDLDNLNAELGKAIGTGISSLSTVNQQLESHRELIEEILASPRTHGFGVMMEEIGLYLKQSNQSEGS